MNLLLKNCKIIVKGKEYIKQIAIVNGKIESVTSNDTNIIPDAKTRVIDIGGKVVIPGVIDPHVHFRDPGMDHKEDFFTGSKAALKGGVTTIFDMPNTNPATLTVELLNEKRKLAKKCLCNWGLYFGASRADNVEEIKKVKNVAATKIFLNNSTGNMLVEENELLKDFFRNSKRVAVHAEGDMVKKALEYNRDYGHGLYLAHISTKKEIEFIRKAKADEEMDNDKHRVFAEVTPHHLFMTENDKVKHGNGFNKMLPSLKTKEDQDALWEGISDGTIDTIGTDHAPHTKEEKLKEEFPYGVPGVETSLPLMLNAVNNGRLSIEKVVELMCNHPANVFGVNGKGYLREDYDADLVVVDMDLEKEVNDEELLTRVGWSPFVGKKLKGWPVMTIVNGNVVFENGKVDIHHFGREVEFE